MNTTCGLHIWPPAPKLFSVLQNLTLDATPILQPQAINITYGQERQHMSTCPHPNINVCFYVSLNWLHYRHYTLSEVHCCRVKGRKETCWVFSGCGAVYPKEFSKFSEVWKLFFASRIVPENWSLLLLKTVVCIVCGSYLISELKCFIIFPVLAPPGISYLLSSICWTMKGNRK